MKKRPSIFSLAVTTLCAILLGISSHAQAEVIYSSFGSEPPGYSLSGYGVGWGPCGLGGMSNCQSDLAAGFTSADNYTLDSISFAAEYLWGEPNSLNSLNVYLASGATQPDVILESFLFTGLSSDPMIYSADSLTHPGLSAGTKYWFVFSPAYQTTIAWIEGNDYIPPDHLISSGDSWQPQAGFLGQMAFSVEGTPTAAPVPEPATMLLLGSGLIGLAGYGRKKLFKK